MSMAEFGVLIGLIAKNNSFNANDAAKGGFLLRVLRVLAESFS